MIKLIDKINIQPKHTRLKGDEMNSKICQIADSAGSLPKEIIEKYNIYEVPFYFKFQDTDYLRENIDYSTEDFYEHMKSEPDNVPQTAAPNINDWLEVFKKGYDEGHREFIVTTISSKLSSSYPNAVQAKNLFLEENKDAQMKVINTLSCACGQAAFEIEIAEMIKKGVNYDELVNDAINLIPKINTLFTVESLKYMKAGGRIGGATEFLGKITNIKPISEFTEGEVKPIKATLGRRKSLRKLVDIAVSRIENFSKTVIVIENAVCEEEAEYIHEFLNRKADKILEVYHSTLGITVGGHSGPGSIGIGFVKMDV